MKSKNNTILSVLNFFVSFGYNAVSKILPAFLATLGHSALQISLISSSYNIGKILSGITGGLLTDWFGKKNSLFLSLVALGIFSFLLAFNNTSEWFTGVFLFIGIFSSFFYLSFNSIVTIVNEKKGRSLSGMEVAYQAGFIIGPFIGGAVVLNYGLNQLFFLWSALMLAAAISVLKINFSDSKNSVRNVIGEYLAVIKLDSFNFVVLIILGAIFVGIVEGARDILVPLHAVDLGFDIFKVGIIFTISSVITMIGIIPLGNFADKIGRKILFILSFLMIAVSFFLFLYTKDLWVIGILTGIISLGRTAGLTGVRAIASDISSPTTRATSLAIVESALSFGRIIGAVATGLLKDRIPTTSVFYIIVWTSLIIVAVYSVIHLKESRHHTA